VEIIEKLLRLWPGAAEEAPAGKRRGPIKPSDLTYGVNDKPPTYVLWIAAIQHVLLASVTTVFPLLVLEAAHASHDTVLKVMSGSLLSLGFGTFLLCLKSRDLGASALMPAAFSGVYFTVTVAAARQGGLPLVAGMTVFAGLVQLLIGHGVQRLRPYLPTEIAGFAMLMSGLTLGVIGFNLITGVSAASDPMGANMGTPALLGVVCLLTMIALFVWGAAGLRLYVILIVLAGGYAAGAMLGMVPFNEVKSASLLVNPPLPSPSWPTFAVNLMLPFAVAAVATSLRAIGDLTTVQKINDSRWQRADMGSIRKGLMANGIGMMIGGLLGSVGLSTSSSSVGLSVTTGVTSRSVGFATGIVFIVLAFLPAVHELIILAPRPVFGAALVFTSCFIIVNGMQAMVSRLMDGRRTLVISVALLLSFSRFLFPGFYSTAPDYLQPVVSSPLVIGLIGALLLNLVFRIGIKKSATITVAPGADALTKLEKFAEHQGGVWGARRDVIDRAVRAMIETAECLELLIAPGKSARVTMTFDEFWLDVTVEYEGKPLITSAAAPSHEELLADESQLTRLGAIMIRRQATRLTTDASGTTQRIHLGFEH
jgi:NCS2 family nucleobase:cation symporter-2